MDNLHSDLREIVDHREPISIVYDRATTSAPPPMKAALETSPAGSGWYHDAAIEAANRSAIEAHSNPYHR